MYEFYYFISYWLDPFFLLYFGTINIFYTILLTLGAIKIYKRHKEIEEEDFTSLLQSSSMPEITFIVPAYNEADNIQSLVDNLANLSYRYKRVIVVNDGSVDATMEILFDNFNLVPIPKHYEETLPTKPIRQVYRSLTYPEIIVIDKENGTKHDALNAGLNLCETHYFILIDADTYVDNTVFESLIRPILSSPETIAIGGTIRIRNGCTLEYNRVNPDTIPMTYVTSMQTIEYLRSFIMRQGWDYLGGNYVISGAFSVFSTELVKELGGYAPTVAEDLEIVLRINRALIAADIPYKSAYLPDPVAWTEGPSTLKELSNQRYNWHRGTCESVWFNKCMFMNPKYRSYGLVVFPFLVLAEAVEPLVEILGYIYIIVGLWLGLIGKVYISMLFMTVWGFGILYTIACILIEDLTYRKYTGRKELFKLIYYTIIESFGYRQMSLYWRFRGFVVFCWRYKMNNKIARAIKKLVDRFLKMRGILNE
jgi:cellulose synthase/poly-beta-1,6-N-acetylglucosamine synthase-like glycosyltransferase